MMRLSGCRFLAMARMFPWELLLNSALKIWCVMWPGPRMAETMIVPVSVLGSAVLLVAQWGGYIDRTSDLPPGHQIMWRGYAQL